MSDVKHPHPGHDKHLCYLSNLRFQDSHPDDFKELIRQPQYYCQNCGRAAASSKNLCKPVKL
ncbi:MAG: hypothetical protein ACYSUT_03890 [Planctomycetota bacterium]|jgi:hypothetical protein